MNEEQKRLEAEAAKRAEEEAASADATRKAAANNSPRANIRLVEGAVAPTAEGEVYPPDGKPIMLPRLEDQKAGFYHPDAARILALYPDRYKPIVEKGGKA